MFEKYRINILEYSVQENQKFVYELLEYKINNIDIILLILQMVVIDIVC